MKTHRSFLLMAALRDEGWCVVLKVLPRNLGWLIEGSRSEYDAPCPDRFVGHGKWLCEAQWMSPGQDWRRPQDSLADTPEEAIQQVWEKVHEGKKRKP